MKYLKLCAVAFLTFFMSIYAVNATSSLSVNKSKIEVGQSVTATVKVTAAAWDIKINGTGSTSSCSKHFFDESGTGKDTTKYLTITCKATGTGSITFKISGLTAPASGGTKTASGTKTVTVVAATPKSTDNFLKELKIEGYEISPSFNQNKFEYTVVTNPGINSIKIIAATNHSKASVKGTGNIEVVEGETTHKIVVTAESGATKTYIIKITVPEKNPIKVPYGDTELSILRNLPESLPQNFIATTVTINEEVVVALYNETLDLTLLYVKDESDNNYFYTFENGKIGEIFIMITSAPTTIYLTNTDQEIKGLEKSKLNIDGTEVDAFRLGKTSNFYLVYGVNFLTTEASFYRYDSVNKTLQLYEDENKAPLVQIKEDDHLLIIYALSGALGLLLIISFLSSRDKAKMKKIIKRYKNEILEKEEPNLEKVNKKTKK